MIELIWVSDAMEAQSQSARRTLLWQRWSSQAGNASPFGISLRPVDSQDTRVSVPTTNTSVATTSNGGAVIIQPVPQSMHGIDV